MATQPVLQGFTLPWPKASDGYGESYARRAVNIETANGNFVFQQVTTTGKREFSLEWVAITDAELATLRSAYDALLSTGGTNNFTGATGSTYTVTPAANNPTLEPRATNTPGGLRWNVSMKLREVSS